MFRKMPIILSAIILLVIAVHAWLPPILKSILYAISLSLKSLIVFALPVLIFGLLFKATVQMTKKASKWIVFILAAICVSNFTSTMVSYSVGTIAYQFDLSMPITAEGVTLTPLWTFSLPKLIGNSEAMFAGLLLGYLCGAFRPAAAEKIALLLEKNIGASLRIFLLAIPLFITGFIVKMMDDGVMELILQNYSLIFALVAGAVFAYISLIYLAVNEFQYKPFVKSLQNMFPAAIAGFGSMSSAAAMPLTILGTEKNSKNSDIARSVIPATVNIHLIGDCFAIPIFAFAIMKSFGVAEPSFLTYLTFAGYFVLAKFSVAAVPGGGILVMLPILENYLGFNGEMLSLITTLYILFDPLITSANILGNGGFAMAIGALAGTTAEESLTET